MRAEKILTVANGFLLLLALASMWGFPSLDHDTHIAVTGALSLLMMSLAVVLGVRSVRRKWWPGLANFALFLLWPLVWHL